MIRYKVNRVNFIYNFFLIFAVPVDLASKSE